MAFRGNQIKVRPSGWALIQSDGGVPMQTGGAPPRDSTRRSTPVKTGAGAAAVAVSRGEPGAPGAGSSTETPCGLRGSVAEPTPRFQTPSLQSERSGTSRLPLVVLGPSTPTVGHRHELGLPQLHLSTSAAMATELVPPYGTAGSGNKILRLVICITKLPSMCEY